MTVLSFSKPLVGSRIRCLISILVLSTFLSCGIVQGLKCPGVCTDDVAKCKNDGGKIIGYCTNSKACCDNTTRKWMTCGQTADHSLLSESSTVVHFKSPNFPNYGSNDLVCDFSLKLKENTTGILLDFQAFETDGVKFGPGSECDVDNFYILGLTGWTPPPFCGLLANYKMIIDKGKLDGVSTIRFLGVLTSPRYRWHIKIRQILHQDCENKAYYDHKKFTGDPGKKGGKNGDSGDTSTPYLKEEGKNESSPVFTSDAYGSLTKPHENKTHFDSPKAKKRRSADEPIYSHIHNVDQLHHIQEGIGQFQNGPKIRPYVVNGDDASQDKVPWQASIRFDVVKIKKDRGVNLEATFHGCDSSEGLHICGGSIISDREILTAAHCFSAKTKIEDMVPLYAAKVVLGDINVCQDSDSNSTSKKAEEGYKNPNVQEFGIESVTMHYAFDGLVILNDVAIIRLNKTIKFSKSVYPISMAAQGEDFSSEAAFVSGWGQTDLLSADPLKAMPNILQYSDNLVIRPQKECKIATIHYLRAPEAIVAKHKKYQDVVKTTLCTSPKNKSRDVLVGPGDSGGPLVVFDPDCRASTDPVLVGIVSYGNPVDRKSKKATAGNFIDYYQSVAYFRKWIDVAVCALRDSRYWKD